jgi:hypothetical protein
MRITPKPNMAIGCHIYLSPNDKMRLRRDSIPDFEEVSIARSQKALTTQSCRRIRRFVAGVEIQLAVGKAWRAALGPAVLWAGMRQCPQQVRSPSATKYPQLASATAPSLSRTKPCSTTALRPRCLAA